MQPEPRPPPPAHEREHAHAHEHPRQHEHVSVYVTSPDRDTARRVARALLERRLVACANLFPVESLYRWEGAIEEAQEVAMFLKTRRERVPDVLRAVQELHPYEVPCAVAFALGEGAAPYYAWVDAETARPAPGP